MWVWRTQFCRGRWQWRGGRCLGRASVDILMSTNICLSHPVSTGEKVGEYRIGAGHSSCHAAPPMHSQECSSPPSYCSAPEQLPSGGNVSSCVSLPQYGSPRSRPGGLSSRQSERKKDQPLVQPPKTGVVDNKYTNPARIFCALSYCLRTRSRTESSRAWTTFGSTFRFRRSKTCSGRAVNDLLSFPIFQFGVESASRKKQDRNEERLHRLWKTWRTSL